DRTWVGLNMPFHACSFFVFPRLAKPAEGPRSRGNRFREDRACRAVNARCCAVAHTRLGGPSARCAGLGMTSIAARFLHGVLRLRCAPVRITTLLLQLFVRFREGVDGKLQIFARMCG